MWTFSVAAHHAEIGDPVSIVLEAEHAALADVERFKRQTLQFVTASCLRAVLVQKRTEARINRLRQRMTANAQLRRVRMDGEMQALGAAIGADDALVAPLDRAISRITEELAGTWEPS